MSNKAILTMTIDFDAIKEEGLLLFTPSWFKAVRENQGVCPSPIFDGFDIKGDKVGISLQLTGTNVKEEAEVEQS